MGTLERLPEILLPWYEQNKRDLPWRNSSDPYRIWVSEIMLQQTRVEAVKGYYARFLERLPDIASLAEAPEDLLHKLWEGLGYYSRVRNLKKAANVIVAEYNGVFPSDYQQILSLPGIGEYTAGAISSIAFNLPIPAVDGNVLRLVSRLTNDDTCVDLPSYKKAVRALLQSIYPKDASAFTQALMELGATVCGPNRKPECQICPCNTICQGFFNKTAGKLPVRMPKRDRKIQKKTVFILKKDDVYAFIKRPEKGLLAGLWQFPDCKDMLSLDQAISKVEQMGLKPIEMLGKVEKKHVFTHIEWHMRGYYMEVAGDSIDFVWFDKYEIAKDTAIPTAYRQFLDVI